jgi:DUF971 family protein
VPGVERPTRQRRHPGRRHPRLTAQPQPTKIDVERERGVTITWDDGRVSRFGLEELRVNCLCAECRGRREQGLDAWPTEGAPAVLRIETAAQVGNWGLNFAWNDGHTTGIFTWEILRGWDDDRSS